MGQIVDEKLNRDDSELYEEYLEEARKQVNLALISDDEDGTLWWFFRCLYTDCRNHEFADKKTNYNDELRLAAESQVICEILTAREHQFAIAI